jgi:hypothetical protein
MDLHAILVRVPVNKLAANVVGQRNVAACDVALTKQELQYVYNRILRKQRLLKFVLGIRNSRHKKNLKYRFANGKRSWQVRKEPRAWAEFQLCGTQLERLARELSAIKAASKK